MIAANVIVSNEDLLSFFELWHQSNIYRYSILAYTILASFYLDGTNGQEDG